MHNKLMTMTRADASVALSYATVSGRAEQWYFLSGAEGLRAVRADSCLIEPECGDSVLVCHAGSQTSYVLAVLARAQRQEACLQLPGGVALHTAQGALQVQAASIRLQASEEVTLEAPQVNLSGVAGQLRFQQIKVTAQELHGRFGTVSSVAQNITSSVGRLVQKARDSFRWIEQLDETRAGRVRMQVRQRFDLKAQDATVLADGQVSIDAQKIDLG
ncbi:DUF3540 domain-containing protein [Janthinobacterium sp. PC23-8]|uniref:DUF3540 domain-containing protein n=1 Tax=Janthinobacterium sp. PC23-8 TaxID=2012679 RepID=UPI000B965DBC|nr:DUF3540 domain-containing protein [Janthinobacterium sp. PC23-8]OYO27936.1 hypothetical protein CD932_22775 [Janthinobacterium sp. PC23-8]